MANYTSTITTHTVRLTSLTKNFFTALFLLLLAPHFIFAQQEGTQVSHEVIKIQPLEGEIELDGRLSETIWSQIAPFPMTQLVPIYEAPMSEETQIYMTYDAKYVYIAAKNLTKDASTIISNTLQRDDYQANDDIIGVVFDSFNDNENGLTFFTNPEGVRVDFAISNDGNFGAGVDAFNGSWNTYWDVETTRDANGWYAEMRIPFSSLGYQVNNDITRMGIIVYRWIASRNERHVFPNIPPNWSMSHLKPSQTQEIEFEQLEELYKTWNAQINVISRKDIDALYEKHVLHALGIAKVQSFKSGAKVLDVGTGGGFPGIPLAILFPKVKFYLIDSIV